MAMLTVHIYQRHSLPVQRVPCRPVTAWAGQLAPTAAAAEVEVEGAVVEVDEEPEVLDVGNTVAVEVEGAALDAEVEAKAATPQALGLGAPAATAGSEVAAATEGLTADLCDADLMMQDWLDSHDDPSSCTEGEWEKEKERRRSFSRLALKQSPAPDCCLCASRCDMGAMMVRGKDGVEQPVCVDCWGTQGGDSSGGSVDENAGSRGGTVEGVEEEDLQGDDVKQKFHMSITMFRKVKLWFVKKGGRDVCVCMHHLKWNR